MNRILIVLAIIMAGLFSGICVISFTSNPSDAEKHSENISSYEISPSDAKEIMNSDEPFILLDVRTIEEFEDRHIPYATLLPSDEVVERASLELPDKNALIIVYCNSGNRSAAATGELIDMGYTNVRDLGGIINWPYEIK